MGEGVPSHPLSMEGLKETVLVIKDFYVLLYIYFKTVLGLIFVRKVDVGFKAYIVVFKCLYNRETLNIGYCTP